MPHELDEAQARAEAREAAINSWIEHQWYELLNTKNCERFVGDWGLDDQALILELVADAKAFVRQGDRKVMAMEYLGRVVTAWADRKVREAAEHSVQPGFFTGEY